ncbi:MAG: ester cyclase [Dehalococcoidia bacterium]
MSEQNKQLVRRFFEQIDTGEPAILDEFISQDYDDHNPPPFPNLQPGIAGSHQAFKLALDAFGEFSHEILDQVAEGDKVVTRVRATGKHTGNFLGIPPTNKDVTMDGITVHRITDGKIVEHWSTIDAFSLFAQLGAIEPPGAA